VLVGVGLLRDGGSLAPCALIIELTPQVEASSESSRVNGISVDRPDDCVRVEATSWWELYRLPP
jgi:hypothetical protein